MPDQDDKDKASIDQEEEGTPLHGYRDSRPEDIKGEVREGEQEPVPDEEKTGGATSGGPPQEATDQD